MYSSCFQSCTLPQSVQYPMDMFVILDEFMNPRHLNPSGAPEGGPFAHKGPLP